MTFSHRLTFTHELPDGKKMWVSSDGHRGLCDPRRGIGLITCETPHSLRVVSMFKRIDNLEASEPFLTEYGRN